MKTKYKHPQINPLYDYERLPKNKRPRVCIPRKGMKIINKSNKKE